MSRALKITNNLENHWWVSDRKELFNWQGKERQGKTWGNKVTPAPSKSNAHSKKRLSTHQRHLFVALPAWNQALSSHSDPFSTAMTPLKKPSRFQGFLTEDASSFYSPPLWSFPSDTHQWGPKGFWVCVISSVYCSWEVLIRCLLV
jgi:hypothetical protein